MRKFFTLLFASFTGILVNAQNSPTPTAAQSAGTISQDAPNNGQHETWTLTNSTSLPASSSISKNKSTKNLLLTNFGFENTTVLPSGKLIKGIEVKVTRSAAGANIADSLVQLVTVTNNVPTLLGTARKSASNWSTTGDETITYGSNATTWGLTGNVTGTVILANFGVAIQAKNNNTTGGGVSASVKAVTMVVYYTDANIAMPVNFTGFEAKKAADGVQLTWKVGTEENVKGYEIERSFNGNTFSKIAFVAAAANSSYSFTDAQPGLGNAYFRIKSVDNNGSFLYSTVVRYNNGKAGVIMKAFPTTTVNNITVQHETATTGAGIIISSLNGHIVKSLVPGTNSIQTSVDVSSLQPGLYLIHYRNKSGKIETEKFLKN